MSFPEERVRIEQHFDGRVCRFMEIGAHDGVTDSLTHGIVQAGWAGVQVEPSPFVLQHLLRNREPYKDIAVVGAAIGDGSCLRHLWIEADGGQRSTIDYRSLGFFQGIGVPYERKPLWIPTLTVASLLVAFNGMLDWQLLVIDAEGESVPILRQFPLRDMVDTEIVCVEVDRNWEETEATLAPWYDCERIGVNVFGVRKK